MAPAVVPCRGPSYEPGRAELPLSPDIWATRQRRPTHDGFMAGERVGKEQGAFHEPERAADVSLAGWRPDSAGETPAARSLTVPAGSERNMGLSTKDFPFGITH